MANNHVPTHRHNHRQPGVGLDALFLIQRDLTRNSLKKVKQPKCKESTYEHYYSAQKERRTSFRRDSNAPNGQRCSVGLDARVLNERSVDDAENARALVFSERCSSLCRRHITSTIADCLKHIC